MPVWTMGRGPDRPADQSFPGTGSNPVYLPYAAVSVLCGLVVGYMVKAGLFRKKWGVVVIWLVCTFVNAISASLITTFVYGGATGVNGTSVLTATLVWP